MTVFGELSIIPYIYPWIAASPPPAVPRNDGGGWDMFGYAFVSGLRPP